MEEGYKNRDIVRERRNLIQKVKDKLVSPERTNYVSVIDDLSDKKKMTSLEKLTSALKHLHGKTTDYLDMKLKEKAGSAEKTKMQSWLTANKNKDGWAQLFTTDNKSSEMKSAKDIPTEVWRQLNLCALSKKAMSFPTSSVTSAMKNVCKRGVILLMEKTIDAADTKDKIIADCASAKKQLAKAGDKPLDKYLKTEIQKLIKAGKQLQTDAATPIIKGAAAELAKALNNDKKFAVKVEVNTNKDVFADDYFTLKKKEDTSNEK